MTLSSRQNRILLAQLLREGARHSSARSRLQRAGATTKDGRQLMYVFLGSSSVATQRSMAGEDLVARVGDILGKDTPRVMGSQTVKGKHTKTLNLTGGDTGNQCRQAKTGEDLVKCTQIYLVASF